MSSLASAFEPGRSAHNSDRLVHDPVAYAQVVINPAFHVFVIREGFGFETGAEMTPACTQGGARESSKLACYSEIWIYRYSSRIGSLWRRYRARGGIYVRPVERLTPARNAETVEHISPYPSSDIDVKKSFQDMTHKVPRQKRSG